MSDAPERIWVHKHSAPLLAEPDRPDVIEYIRAPQWIPVSERLPEFDGGYILVLWDDGDVVLWRSSKLAGGKDYVTHWMPLPEPPEDA